MQGRDISGGVCGEPEKCVLTGVFLVLLGKPLRIEGHENITLSLFVLELCASTWSTLSLAACSYGAASEVIAA
jgi:hypothetical protein